MLNEKERLAMENFSSNLPCRYEITNREKLILQYITDGYDNMEIAEKIHVSIHTVKAHVSAIIKKLHAKNRAHAACIALRKGICK